MSIKGLKTFEKKKTIFFMGMVFVFLFFGSEVFAGSCSAPPCCLDQPSWNKTQNCGIDITFTDPCLNGECSGLKQCWYKITHNTQGTALDWTSENCTGLSFTKSFSIGPTATYCTASGVCTINGYAVDQADNSGPTASKSYNLDFNKPVTTVNSPDVGSWHTQPNFGVSISDSDTGGSGLNTSECRYRVISYDAAGSPTITKDNQQRTLEEVGREFGVTRERIRQIEAKALRKLRHPSRSRRLKDYLQ